MVLLTPKHFEIQCFGIMFATANQWEVTKLFFIFPPLLQISIPNLVCTSLYHSNISWTSFKTNTAGNLL